MKWAYSDEYLSQTMWNHAKNSMKMLKRANSLFLLCEISSAVQKHVKLFELKRELLKIVKYYALSRGVPCESLRPKDSENVVLFGSSSF